MLPCQPEHSRRELKIGNPKILASTCWMASTAASVALLKHEEKREEEVKGGEKGGRGERQPM